MDRDANGVTEGSLAMRGTEPADGGDCAQRQIPTEIFLDVIEDAAKAEHRHCAAVHIRFACSGYAVTLEQPAGERHADAIGVQAAAGEVAVHFILESPGEMFDRGIAHLEAI